MIDIDHFKMYNDHYGHLAGDACLRAVGEALAQTSEAAIVARYGGEEFALLFARTAMEPALDLAETLRDAIEALALPHVSRPSGHVTVSVGVASLRAANGNSAQTLIEAADAALYGAKRRGRNAVVGHAASTSRLPRIRLTALIKEDHATRASARVPTCARRDASTGKTLNARDVKS